MPSGGGGRVGRGAARASLAPRGRARVWGGAGGRAARSRAERLLSALRPGASLVTVCDSHPATLSWLGSAAPVSLMPLGVDHFGQSGDIPDLYRVYGIDSDAIIDAAARALLRTAGFVRH